jgi:hypothetical protein
MTLVPQQVFLFLLLKSKIGFPEDKNFLNLDLKLGYKHEKKLNLKQCNM